MFKVRNYGTSSKKSSRYETSVQVAVEFHMLILRLRMVKQVIPMVSWSQLCSRKWPNIWTPFMSLVGSVLQRLRQRMSLRPILQTIQWYETIHNPLPPAVNDVRIPSPTKFNSFSWLNFSTTVNSVRKGSPRRKRTVFTLQTRTF